MIAPFSVASYFILNSVGHEVSGTSSHLLGLELGKMLFWHLENTLFFITFALLHFMPSNEHNLLILILFLL